MATNFFKSISLRSWSCKTSTDFFIGYASSLCLTCRLNYILEYTLESTLRQYLFYNLKSFCNITQQRGEGRLTNKKDEPIRQTGAYLKRLRLDKGLSLVGLGEELGVSAAYLSNVESGNKSMSDYFVRQIADFYKQDETVLFEMLDRVPLLAREQLMEDSNLQSLLVEIKRNKKLSDAEKQNLFQQMYELYKKFE